MTPMSGSGPGGPHGGDEHTFELVMSVVVVAVVVSVLVWTVAGTTGPDSPPSRGEHAARPVDRDDQHRHGDHTGHHRDHRD